ncbi:MAG: polysaccharide biosynthesis tyrosine autokinase [Cyanobacteria bacterium P01_A01_bin.84]
MLKTEKYPNQLLTAKSTQLNDTDEGGLNLGQVGATLRRRALLILGVTGIIATAAGLKSETDPPVYEGKFEVLTKPVSAEEKAVANVPQTLTSQGASSQESVKGIKTTIKVLQSRGVLSPVIERLKTKHPEITYKKVLAGLNIESTNKNILTVEYTHPEEQVVTDVLNAIQEAYLNYSLKDRRSDIQQAIKFVERQKQPLDKRVREWQERLRTLRQTHNLVEPTQKAQEVSSHITSLTQQRLENRVQFEQMMANYQNLQKELNQQPGASASNSILNENSNYQSILNQIAQINAEIAKRSSVFTSAEIGMQSLKDKKSTMVSLLEQERQRVNRDFQSRIQSLRARDLALGEKIDGLNAYLRSLASVTRDYNNIERELKIATDALVQFTSKQQALEIEFTQRLQPWRVLDPELTEVNEPEAFSASTKTNIALGTMLGMLLGVGAALVIDKLSNVFYSSKDLKETVNMPLLGVVPYRKELANLKANDLVNGVEQVSRASFFEVFRSLYTNILLLGSDSQIRSLVISSAAQEEGKSTVAMHLALAAAAMGQRVLLVDANLRFPTLHKRLGLMNIQGLTDIISSDLEWSNVIERSPTEENLYVMSAGPIPPDSVRLLASEKMQDLMNDLQASFDLVIYDTPPLVGFADANLLAAHTNGMVLVAALGKLKRTVFKQALEELQVSGTPILGMVANRSKDSAPASYSYYEQYYRRSMSAQNIQEEEESSVTTS